MVLFMHILQLPVVRNDISAYLVLGDHSQAVVKFPDFSRHFSRRH